MRGNNMSPINRCVYCGEDKANMYSSLGNGHMKCYNLNIKPKYDEHELYKLELKDAIKQQYAKRLY